MYKPRIKNLKELTEMKKAHYCHKYIQQMRSACMLLENMAVRIG